MGHACQDSCPARDRHSSQTKYRCAEHGGDQSGGDLGGGDDRPAQGVGEADQQRAQQGGDRVDPVPAAAHQRAGGVGADEPDEADDVPIADTAVLAVSDDRARQGGQPGRFHRHAQDARVCSSSDSRSSSRRCPATSGTTAASADRHRQQLQRGAAVGGAGEPGQRGGGVPGSRSPR